jgi:hypothetical protein
MTDNHPITPPPELFKQWEDNILNERDNVDHVLDCAWRNGFQAGADQELEACCEWLDEHLAYENNVTNNLRADRRPKPKSLKQQAIDELVAAYNADQMDDTTFETLGRIIKSLPD